ncbi:MAG: type II toxin-antitoxin system VapC family toxin [Pirellulales bacterium]|nr:type II toxin-antitoxin system VapC family toxin [Pirellulales bacterium]
MHLLDTDTLIHLHAGHERVIARLGRCDDPDIGVTIFTKAEILQARYESILKAADGERLLQAQTRLLRNEELLSELTIITFDRPAAKIFQDLHARKGLKKIGHVDLLIASLAMANRATLVTRNLRHFKQIPGLKLENWVD